MYFSYQNKVVVVAIILLARGIALHRKPIRAIGDARRIPGAALPDHVADRRTDVQLVIGRPLRDGDDLRQPVRAAVPRGERRDRSPETREVLPVPDVEAQGAARIEAR